MEWLIIFGFITSCLIGLVFIEEGIYKSWFRCNIFGKVGIILMGILSSVGIMAFIGMAVIVLSLSALINHIVDLKRYFLKKEYRG